MHTSPVTLAAMALAALAIAMPGQWATAAPRPLPAQSPPPEASPAPVTVAEVYQFTPPAGARVWALPASPTARQLTLSDPPARITILTSPRPDATLTSPRAVQGLLDAFAATTQVRKADTREVIGAQLRVLSRADDIAAPGVGPPGSRAVIQYQAPSGPRAQAWTVFVPYTDLLLNIELDCAAEDLGRALPHYDALVASLNFDTAAPAARERQRAVLAGDALVRSITPQELRAAADGVERWYRLHRPAEGSRSGTEAGYRSVRAWAGRASELAGGAAPPGDGPPEGVLTRVVTRTLAPLPGASAPRVIDTVSSAFVSFDRSQETWTVQTVVTDPGSRRPSAATVTALRRGAQLQVSSTIPGQPARAFHIDVPDAGVISQAELLLLPRLLQSRGLHGVELGFYAYQIDAEAFVLRRLALRDPASEPSGAATDKRAPGLAPGLALATRWRDEPAWALTPLGPDGWPTGADPATGLHATPATRRELLELWNRLGLPTGSPGPAR